MSCTITERDTVICGEKRFGVDEAPVLVVIDESGVVCRVELGLGDSVALEDDLMKWVR